MPEITLEDEIEAMRIEIAILEGKLKAMVARQHIAALNAGLARLEASRWRSGLLDAATREVEVLRAKAGLPPIKTPWEQAMRETIQGQGLSMQVTGNELLEKDVTIEALREEVGRLQADRDNSNTLLDECRHERNVLQRISASRATQIERLGGIVDPLLSEAPAQSTTDDVDRGSMGDEGEGCQGNHSNNLPHIFFSSL